MTKYISKRIFIIIGLLIIGIFAGVFGINFKTTKYYTLAFGAGTLSNDNGTQYTIQYIPITKVEIASDVLTLEPGDSAQLCVNLTPSYALATTQKITYEIVSGQQFAMLSGNIVTARTDSDFGGSVLVSATVDGIQSYNLIEISVEKQVDIVTYVPVTSVTLSKKDTIPRIDEGGQYNFDDIFNYSFEPSSATMQYVTYEVTAGKQYVDARGTNFTVFDNLTKGNLFFNVRAWVGGVASNEITVNIYVPAKGLDLVVDNERPMSWSGGGDSVTATATIDETATENAIKFFIIQGANLIQGNYVNGGEISSTYVSDTQSSATFMVKNNLTATPGSLNKAIIIEARQGTDAYARNSDIQVSIPVESFSPINGSISRDGTGVEFNPIPNNYADNGQWIIESSSSFLHVVGNIVTVDRSISAGTTGTIAYKAVDNRIATGTFYAYYTVANLTDISKFAPVYGDDSAGIALSKTNPQLWIGRSTTVGLTYNAFTLSSYGLTNPRITSLTGQGTYQANTTTLAATATASGKTAITYMITVTDGTATYTLPVWSIAIFNPLTSVSLSSTTMNTASFTLGINGLTNSTLNVADLDVSVVGTGYTVSGNGTTSRTLTASASTTLVDPIVIIRYENFYNGISQELKETQITVTRRFAINQTQLVNLSNKTGDWYIVANITLSGEWTPIAGFTGTLYGNNYTISGMTITISKINYSAEQYFGLFGQLNGNISNLKLSNISILGDSQQSGSTVNVGGIAGYLGSNKTISGCSISSGTINIDRVWSRVGGVVGFNYWGTITNTSNYATVTSNGDMGGIVGQNDTLCSVTYCINNGRITYWLGSSLRSIGGIIGYNRSSAAITNNTNYGYVNITSAITQEVRMGYIIGHNETSSFDTSNVNYGGCSGYTYTYNNGFLGIGKYNNSVYMFANYDGRVGRQG